MTGLTKHLGSPNVLTMLRGSLAALLAIVLLAGCSGGARTCPACQAGGSAATPAVLAASQPADISARYRKPPSRYVIDGRAALQTVITRAFAITVAQPPTILLLSGGGSYGSWGAGVLNGWSAAGNRPPAFNIVTGISTGAMIATYAYLGAGADATMKTVYTTLTTGQVYTDRFLPWALFFSSSLKDTDPLDISLPLFIPTTLIDQVATEYAATQRALLVGTVNFDSGEFIVWNMGEVAAAHDYQRYWRILRAATALPVIFTPVLIDDELHVDGGAREQIFGSDMASALLAAWQSLSRPGTPTAYLIVNGQIGVRRQCVRPRILPMALRTVGVMMDEGMIGNLYRVRALLQGWSLNLSKIPNNYIVGGPPYVFDPAFMTPLFNQGFAWASTAPQPWEPLPDDSPLSLLPCEASP